MSKKKLSAQRAKDEALMAGLIAFTAKSMETETPVPFGALIVETMTGQAADAGVELGRRGE